MAEADKQAKEQQENKEQLERSYNRLFTGAGDEDDAKKVLDDLANTCFVNASTWNGRCDRDSVLINEGCRRVFLRIAQQMRMDMTHFYLAREQAKLKT